MIDRHHRDGAIVDTNLMLLYLVGRYDVNKIAKFRATRKYDASIFNLLAAILARFRTFYTTPNVITEGDNLSRQVDKAEWGAISRALRTLVAGLSEVAFPSANLVNHAVHAKFGVTDCSILSLASGRALVLTDDLNLTVELERRGRPVVNLSRDIV